MRKSVRKPVLKEVHSVLFFAVIIVVPFLVACSSRPTSPAERDLPLVFDDLTTGWSFLDARGEPIPQWQGSSELSAAYIFQYKGNLFKTPFLKDLHLADGLKPLRVMNSSNKSGPIANSTLRLPILRKTEEVSSWTGIKLSSGSYFISGGALYSSSNGPNASLKETWFFDPKLGKAVAGPSMEHGRVRHSLTELKDGRILIIGGEDLFTNKAIKSIEIVDPRSRAIADGGTLCIPRTNHGVVQLQNGDVLVVGGYTSADAESSPTASVEVINLSNMKSRIVGVMLIERSHPVVIPFESSAIVAGGWHRDMSGDYRWVRNAELFRTPIGQKAQ